MNAVLVTQTSENITFVHWQLCGRGWGAGCKSMGLPMMGLTVHETYKLTSLFSASRQLRQLNCVQTGMP